jgi:hypothetical protein
MHFETTLTYSVPLLRQAVFAFWRRTVGPGFWVALLLVGASLGFLVAQGASSWLAGVVGTVFVAAVLFVTAIYVVHWCNALAKLRGMGSPSATFSAGESSFTMSSGAGSATLQWSAVTELWETPAVWLLLYSKAHFSTLPVACMPPEMQAFIRQRVQAAGGKIVS